jgi:hypothetical protein
MTSTYSDSYKLELQETGANANTWGNNTNTNLETVDAFTAGYLSKSVAGSANVTLTTANASPTSEASNKVIEFTGALTGDITVFVPAVESNYIFFNNTTGSQTLTVAPTGHGSNGVAITQGAHTIMYCKNGDTMVDLFANSLGNLSIKNTLTVNNSVFTASNGTVNATTYSGNGSSLTGVSSIPSGSSALFFQSSAPNGWTQNTDASINTTTLRVVTGTGGGTGGGDGFSTVFTSSKTSAPGTITFDDLSGTSASAGTLAVGSTTLSTPTIPSHNHPFIGGQSSINDRDDPAGDGTSKTLNATGGNGGHTHPISGGLSLSGNTTTTTSLTVPAMDIKFANVIACTKD